MKPIFATAAVVTFAAGLAACSKPETPAPAAPAATSDASAMPHDMSNMPITGQGIVAHGTGMVTAVDPAGGTVTLDHQPIPEANWPAMTMTFNAAPEVTQAVKPGDTVGFDVRLEGGAGTVTAIRKR